MLQPKRTKFRKQFKGRIHGTATSGADLTFGSYGLKALEPERVTARQIEAARRAITRHMKRSGRVWIRVFPGVPDQARQGHVRDRRHPDRYRTRGAPSRRGEAAGTDALRRARCGLRGRPM